jgi:hypothetical protein
MIEGDLEGTRALGLSFHSVNVVGGPWGVRIGTGDGYEAVKA